MCTTSFVTKTAVLSNFDFRFVCISYLQMNKCTFAPPAVSFQDLFKVIFGCNPARDSVILLSHIMHALRQPVGIWLMMMMMRTACWC